MAFTRPSIGCFLLLCCAPTAGRLWFKVKLFSLLVVSAAGYMFACITFWCLLMLLASWFAGCKPCLLFDVIVVCFACCFTTSFFFTLLRTTQKAMQERSCIIILNSSMLALSSSIVRLLDLFDQADQLTSWSW